MNSEWWNQFWQWTNLASLLWQQMASKLLPKLYTLQSSAAPNDAKELQDSSPQSYKTHIKQQQQQQQDTYK